MSLGGWFPGSPLGEGSPFRFRADRMPRMSPAEVRELREALARRLAHMSERLRTLSPDLPASDPTEVRMAIAQLLAEIHARRVQASRLARRSSF